ncbi:MAG: hypothetical protein ABI718_15410 [Acidobacteriota bacterium]
MTGRQRLHELVEELEENQIDLAIRILEVIESPAVSRTKWTIHDAPIDDEPFDPSVLEEGEREPLIPHDEVVREFLK